MIITIHMIRTFVVSKRFVVSFSTKISRHLRFQPGDLFGSKACSDRWDICPLMMDSAF